MLRSKVAFTVRQPMPDGSVLTIEMVRFEPLEIFPGLFLNRGTTGEMSSPVGSGALKEPGTGEPAPRSPPEPGEDRGSPVSIRAHPGAQTEAREHNLKDELRSLREALADVSRQVSELHDILAQSDAETRVLQDRLRSSHGGRGDLSRSAIDVRRPVFGQLNALAERWGGQRRERRELIGIQRSMQKHITDTERRLANERRKPNHDRG